LDDLSFLSIDADEKNWMEREFEESEVLEVVRVFFFFARSVGRYLKEDIVEVFKEFHSRGKFE
jgi:hypothetical protein